MNDHHRIIILEDSAEDAELIKRQLSNHFSFESKIIETKEAYEYQLNHFNPTLILCDYTVPSFSGTEALELYVKKAMDIPFIIVSGTIGEEKAAQSIKNGATAFLLKSNLKKLYKTIIYAFQQKDTENQLKQKTEDLLKANKELEDFVHISSHDLQEPLKTIMGYSDYLYKNYSDQFDQKAHTMLKTLYDSSKRMKSYISGLLEFSQIGKREEITRVNLNEVIEEICSDLSFTIKELNAEIQYGNLPSLDVYKTDIKHLFQNLIVNALKYSRKDVPPLITIQCHANDHEVEFKISDNGIGIPKEHHETIFQMFTRLNSNDEIMGTGIGLPFCKKIVELHGGNIWIKSELGSGTDICFTLHMQRKD